MCDLIGHNFESTNFISFLFDSISVSCLKPDGMNSKRLHVFPKYFEPS